MQTHTEDTIISMYHAYHTGRPRVLEMEDGAAARRGVDISHTHIEHDISHTHMCKNNTNTPGAHLWGG